MTPTKFQLKKLERVLDRAKKLSWLHADAVNVAIRIFEETFNVEEVPEECFSISGGNAKNEVGSLFNDFVNHGENMAGDNATTEELVTRMVELMAMKEDE